MGYALRKDVFDLLRAVNSQSFVRVIDDQLHIGSLAAQTLDRGGEVGLAVGEHLNRRDIDHLEPEGGTRLTCQEQEDSDQEKGDESFHDRGFVWKIIKRFRGACGWPALRFASGEVFLKPRKWSEKERSGKNKMAKSLSTPYAILIINTM